MKSHNPIILLFTSPPDTGHKTQLPESPLPALVKSLSRQQVRWPSLWLVLFYIFYCLAHFMRWTAFYKISNEVRNIRASWNDPNRVQFMQNKLFQTNSKILECVIGIKVIILNCSFKKRTLVNLVVSRKFFCKAQPLIPQEKCHCVYNILSERTFIYFFLNEENIISILHSIFHD